MSKVAIIDDRKDVRDRLAKRITMHLKEESKLWEVISMEPLLNIEDYPVWIINEKISLLIVDEKLKEVPTSGRSYTSYNGHQMVKEIRKTNKQIPIVMITAHSDDHILEGMKGEFDDIISRTKFTNSESSRQYVKRFIRYTKTYLDNFELEYGRLAELSELIALEKAKKEDIIELKALQTKLELPLSPFIPKDRTDWLAELEIKTNQLDTLYQKLSEYISKNK